MYQVYYNITSIEEIKVCKFNVAICTYFRGFDKL